MKLPEKLDITIIPLPSAVELANDLSGVFSSNQRSDRSADSASSTEIILQKALVENANQVWRILTSVIDSESKEIKELISPQEIKKVANAIEKLIATFDSLGIRIIDRLGESFNAGLPDQVVTEEPREGLTREQIIRTIRPTIMWNQTMVQRGEIDIAVPSIKE
jgi:hypothetical protein